MTGATTEAEMIAQIEERKAGTPRGAAKRAALVEAMELKNYEFNAHGVEMGQFYSSAAIVSDGSARPVPDRDPELYSSRRPCRGEAPARLGRGQHPQAVHPRPGPVHQVHADHRDRRRGLGGRRRQGPRDLGVPLEAVVIGPGREVTDIYYDWARIREVAEEGALLVRPDKHIGWRSTGLPDGPGGRAAGGDDVTAGRLCLERCGSALLPPGPQAADLRPDETSEPSAPGTARWRRSPDPAPSSLTTIMFPALDGA